MRKNQKVIFFEKTKRYNPETSQYNTEIKKVGEYYCNVTDLTRQKSLEAYGEYIKKGKTIRLTNSVPFKFSVVEINGDKFNLFDVIDANGRTSIVVKGVDM